jgi:hypothetical protein
MRGGGILPFATWFLRRGTDVPPMPRLLGVAGPIRPGVSGELGKPEVRLPVRYPDCSLLAAAVVKMWMCTTYIGLAAAHDEWDRRILNARDLDLEVLTSLRLGWLLLFGALADDVLATRGLLVLETEVGGGEGPVGYVRFLGRGCWSRCARINGIAEPSLRTGRRHRPLGKLVEGRTGSDVLQLYLTYAQGQAAEVKQHLLAGGYKVLDGLRV